MSFKAFYGLVSEDGKNLSLGRVAFWVLFVVLIWRYAIFGDDPGTGMMTLIGLLLGYGVTKKVTGAVIKSKEIGNAGKPPMEGEG